MRVSAGPGAALLPLLPRLHHLGPPREEGHHCDRGPLQRPAAGAPGEQPPVPAGGGAAGHEDCRGQPGQGDLPVPHLKVIHLARVGCNIPVSKV